MGEIYATTSQILIWLGEGTAETEETISYVRTVADFMSSMPGFGPSLLGSPMGQIQFRNIQQEIFTKPWWQRAWIIQEAAFGRNHVVLVGSTSCSLSDLITIAECSPWGVPTFGGIPTTADYGLDAARFIRLCAREQSGKRPLDLQSLIGFSRGFDASDARDKIFALSGLATDIPEDVLLPDYFLGECQVYRDVATFLLSKYKSLDFLDYVRHPTSTETRKDLSSWIPDFGRPVKGLDAVSPCEFARRRWKMDAVTLEFGGDRIWNDRLVRVLVPHASGDLEAAAKVHDTYALETKGIVIAKLNYLGESGDSRGFFQQILESDGDFVARQEWKSSMSHSAEMGNQHADSCGIKIEKADFMFRGGQYSDLVLPGFSAPLLEICDDSCEGEGTATHDGLESTGETIISDASHSRESETAVILLKRLSADVDWRSW